MTDAPAESAHETILWPQPGGLWSTEMVAQYGRLILDLDHAFERVLTAAPALTEAESESEALFAAVDRSMWPAWTDGDLTFIFDAVRHLPLSGIEKKIARIEAGLGHCQSLRTESGARARVNDLGEEEDPTDKAAKDAAAARLAAEIRALRQHVSDELEEFAFLLISEDDVSLFSAQAPLFGDDVFNRFSVANDDVAEAGKCLALQRGTAAVFHLMRVMEAGLRALASELGIPYAPSWESYTKQIDEVLKPDNYKRLPDDKKAKRAFYEEILGDLVAVKRAWRNPTMHIVRSYDVPQARVAFEAVKSLMAHLASELSADPASVISTGQSA